MADNDFLSRSRDAGSDAVQKAQDALEQVLGQINRASDNLKTTSEPVRPSPGAWTSAPRTVRGIVVPLSRLLGGERVHPWLSRGSPRDDVA